jgi:DNA-binding transcriptional MerR regulator
MTGLTVRTLHYYDQIGLLKPDKVTDTGYRLYGSNSLEKIQQILFFRELDFPLDEIRDIMNNPDFDRELALQRQKELLVKKRRRLDKLIDLIDKIIKGDENMSFREFDTTDIEAMKKQYASEVRERWGKTDAYTEFEEKTRGLAPRDLKILMDKIMNLLKKFAENRELPPDGNEAKTLVREWQNFITENFYTCTDEILSSLGQLYSCDERFRKNIDQYGKGTAKFMSDAIMAYCKK